MLNSLTVEMAANRSLFLLTSDTGFHVFDELRQQFSDRVLNVGISEAAMISMAAGLARSGKQVFVYGIAPFVTMRCFEQIRVDLCYPRLPVKIIGVGAGLVYGPAGMTHHAIEDIAVMTCLPNMTVVCPGDPVEAEAVFKTASTLRGPCYIRLGKSGEEVVHQRPLKQFVIGKALVVRQGREMGLISTGNMLPTALRVSSQLQAKGVQCEVISMHTVKPIDRQAIIETASRCSTLATIEEHSSIGGLGSMVGSVIFQEALRVRLKQFAIPDRYAEEAGSQEYLRASYGLDANSITENLLELIEKAQK